MSSEYVTIELKVDWFWAIAVVLAFGAAFIVVAALLPRSTERSALKRYKSWLGFEDWNDIFVVAGTIVASAALLFAIVATFAVNWHTIRTTFLDPLTSGPSLGAGTLIIGLLGAPFLIWRTIVAQQTVDLAKSNQVTGLINSAVEGLGATRVDRQAFEDAEGKLVLDENKAPVQLERTNPNIEVRTGAILALERVATDNPEFHIQIMEILCTYVRENAKVSGMQPSELPFERRNVRTDIQLVLRVLGKRSEVGRKSEADARYRLDLSNSDLRGADLSNGDWSGAVFDGSNMEAAVVENSDLTGSRIRGCLLNFVSLRNTTIHGTNFATSVINRPGGAGVSAHVFLQAKMKSILLSDVEFTAVNYLGPLFEDGISFGTEGTRLGHELEFERPSKDDLFRASLLYSRLAAEEKDAKLEEIRDGPFRLWFPFSSTDLAIGESIRAFRDEHGLRGWPFDP